MGGEIAARKLRQLLPELDAPQLAGGVRQITGCLAGAATDLQDPGLRCQPEGVEIGER